MGKPNLYVSCNISSTALGKEYFANLALTALILSTLFISGCGSGIFGTPGVTITPTQDFTTSENGETTSFTIALNSAPSSPATVSIESSDTSEITISPKTVIFDSENWSAPQTITASGIDDNFIDGNQIVTIITHPIISNDTNYTDLNPKDISITNSDNDTAGITVSPSDFVLSESNEHNNSVNFSISLNTKPAHDVSIDIKSSDTTEILISIEELEEKTDSLTVNFTSDNWSIPQIIKAIATDDKIADGTKNVLIHFQNISSSDSSYNNLSAQQITVAVNDNDSAGISINPATRLQTSESGGQASFTVALNSEPASDVNIEFVSEDTSEGVIDKDSLKFTTENFSEPQEIIVTGVDDNDFDDNQTYSIITHEAVSDDAVYNGINPEDITVINIDNEPVVSVVLNGNLNTSESGDTSFFDIILNKQPQSNIVIEVSTDSPTEGLITGGNSPSTAIESLTITFTPEDWATSQKVIALGQDDEIADGNQTYNIQLSDSISDDSDFNGINFADIEFVNSDNDTPGLTIHPTADLNTSEDGFSDSFSVTLNTQPNGIVILDVTSSDVSEGLVKLSSSSSVPQEKTQLIFTTEDWSTSQTVTVVGVSDVENDGDQNYSITVAPELLNTTDATGYTSLSSQVISVKNSELFSTRYPPRVLTLNTELFHSGVATKDKSYFQIKGLEPNKAYAISFSDSENNVDLTSFSNQLWNNAIGRTWYDNTAGNVVVVNSDSEGNLWLSAIEITDTETGSEFSFHISPYSGALSEGTYDKPIKLSYENALPHNGTVGFEQSIYEIIDLEPNTKYVVSLLNISDSADHHVITKNSHYWGCNSKTTENNIESCATISDVNGKLSVYVYSKSRNGTSFTLKVSPYTGLSSEGSKNSPYSIKYEDTLSHGGTAGPDHSYYLVSNLTRNTVYNISVKDAANYTTLAVDTNNLFFSTIGCHHYYSTNDIDAACSAASSASGTLWVKIESNTSTGTSYTLEITEYSGKESEGTRDQPFNLVFNEDLPHNGSASPMNSYYKISGLILNTPYHIAVTNNKNITVCSYSTTYKWDLTCPYGATDRTTDIDTTLISNSSGELYVKVQSPKISSGVTYTLNISNYSGYPSEGTSDEPKLLKYNNDFPYTGSASPQNSFYLVSHLTPNTPYEITISEITGNTGFSVLKNNTVDSDSILCNNNYKENCVAIANESGNLWINVDSWDNTFGASYTINIADYSGIPSEGTIIDPITLNMEDLQNYSGKSSPTNSYYHLKNLAPNTLYDILLSDLTDDVNLRVFIHSSLSIFGGNCISTNLGTEEETCTVVSNNEGEIWILVDGKNTIEGATYLLSVSEYSGLPAEGTEELPLTLDLDLNLPHAGSVNPLNSYYKITGLSSEIYYNITLSNLSGSVGIDVFSGAWSSRSCNSSYSNSGIEQCATKPNSEGVVWVKVTNQSYSSEVTYSLFASPYSGLPSEGTYNTPHELSLESDFPHLGSTSPSDSYYLISGLAENTPYNISLSDMTDDLTFNSNSCGSNSIQYATFFNQDAKEICTMVSDSSGNLSIGVNGTSNSEGATYIINISNYDGLPSEGTELNPHDLSFESDFPYQGTTGPLDSYYRITNLSSNAIYEISLSNLTDNLSLEVKNNLSYAYSSWKHCGRSTFYTSYYFSFNTDSNYEDKSCSFISIEPGEFVVRVNGIDNSTGSTFSLNVREYSGTPSEGTSEERYGLSFENDLPHNGSTDPTGSYYQVSGLMQNTLYDISLSNLTDNHTVFVSATTGFSMGINNCGSNIFSSINTNYDDKSCTKKSDELGKLNINISGTSKVDGATYTLNLTEYAGPPSEGTQVDPLILPFEVSFPHSGSTNPTNSYYKVTGLNPGSLYTIFITENTDYVSLKTTTTPWSYTTHSNWTTHSFHNKEIADENGAIWISITNSSTSSGGATYTLNVEPYSGKESEGSLETPHMVTFDSTPYNGTVGSYSSYYRITELTPNTAYTITLDNYSDDVYMKVFSDDSFNQVGCPSWSDTRSCTAITNESEALLIEVSGRAILNGATFSLSAEVNPNYMP